MPRRIIIDADPGIGDALAIAVALRDPALDVVGLTAAAGRVSGRKATHNIQGLVEMLDPPKWPRVGGSDVNTPDIRPGEASWLTALNGPTGLGEFEFRVAELHNQRDSAKVMVDLVRDHPYEITLLTLGPLTNLSLALERAPDFLSLLGGLVCLGGSIEAGGDVTAAAEYNIWADPDSARTVLRSPATKTLVPLDVSQQAVLTFERWHRLADGGGPFGRFCAQVLPYAFRAHHEYLGLEGIRLPELLALAVIAQPDLFDTRPMSVDVETAGELTRGTTVFDRRRVGMWQANIDVVSAFESQRFNDWLTERLSR